MKLFLPAVACLLTLLFLPQFATAQNTGCAERRPKAAIEMQNDAQKIWEQAIVAKGGRKRLEGVENVVVSTFGTYKLSTGRSNKVRTEALFVFPNKTWAWVDTRPDKFGVIRGNSTNVQFRDERPLLHKLGYFSSVA